MIANLNILVTGEHTNSKIACIKQLIQYKPDHTKILEIWNTTELKLKRTYPSKQVDTFKRDTIAKDATYKRVIELKPEYMVIDEVYGGKDSLRLVQLFSLGQAGVTTALGSSPTDALYRIVTNIVKEGTPRSLIVDIVSTNIDIVIHVKKAVNKEWGIAEIIEVTEYTDLNDLKYSILFTDNTSSEPQPRAMISNQTTKKLLQAGITEEDIPTILIN